MSTNSTIDTTACIANEEHATTPPSVSAEQPAPPAFATAFGYGSNSKRKTKNKMQYYNHVNKQSVLDLAKVPTRKNHSHEGVNGTSASSDVSKRHMSKQSNEQSRTSLSSMDSHTECNSPITSSVSRFLKYPAEPPTRVLDFLYLGTVEDATDVEFLHSHHIEVIINVSEEEYWTVDKNIVVFPFKVKDLGNFDISTVFAPTRKIINRVRKLYFDALNHTKSFELSAEETSSTSRSRSHVHHNNNNNRSCSTLSKASNKSNHTTTIHNNENNTLTNDTSKAGKGKNYHEKHNSNSDKTNSNSTLSSNSSHHAPCVLVHCLKGRSRSATIVLAYLIYYNGWSVAEAMRYILQRRPSIEPNLGFIESLRQLQESMDVNERSRKCSAQSILLRNVALTTSSVEVVKTYLETHVGLVRDVVMQGVRSSDKAQLNENNSNAEEHQIHNSQKEEDTIEISGNSEAGRPDKGEVHPIDNATLGEHNESTLCMVFFVCMENVARARQHIITDHTLFEKLVGRFNMNKPIKVSLPNRLITSASEGRRAKSNEAVTPTKSTLSISKIGVSKKKITWPVKNEKEMRTPLRAGKVRTPLSTTPIVQLHLPLPSSSSSERVQHEEEKER